MTDIDAPVANAIVTRSCGKCGASVGTPCQVKIHGRLRPGAHHARMIADMERKP